MEQNKGALTRTLVSLALGAVIGVLIVCAMLALCALIALKTGNDRSLQTVARIVAALAGGFCAGFVTAGRIGKNGLMFGALCGILSALLMWIPAGFAGAGGLLWPSLVCVVGGLIGGVTGVHCAPNRRY